MTDYFEVHARDGAARLGELRLTEPVTTPALADDVLRDAGSEWVEDHGVPEGDEAVLTVLPHRGFPSGAHERVQSSFQVDSPDVSFPSAAVVTPTTAADYGADAYVLSGAPGFVGHAEALREAIVETRTRVPSDTALVLSGVATPANVPLLVYAGVDLVDSHRAIVKGTQGKYLTSDGERFLEDLEELPCACPACQQPAEEFTRRGCAEHNVNALVAELATVRERIRTGRLRDYLEGQVRFEPWLTAGLREFDQQWGYLEARVPVFRDSLLAATTEDALHRAEIQRFAERVTTRYQKRLDDVPLLLVPCSATKPYSESQSHEQFQDAARYRAHLVSMTSPIGVVPQELELTYPAQHYDAAVTGHWSEDEIAFVAEVLARYLDRHDYPRVVAHVPEHGYRAVCERVEREVDVPFEYTVEDHPTTNASLSNLAAALEDERTIQVGEKERATVRAVADYQFGDGAGDELFGGFRLQGRYPKLTAFDGDDQLAALVPQYGLLALGLAGARRWVDSPAPIRRVEIDSFVPHGNVLAPGVVDATEDIRVGDEVVVEGPRAFGVGRAEMHGAEMVASSRGVAVDVRHVEER